MSLSPDSSYQKLIIQIGDLLHQGRQQATQAVNHILVQTYWQIGQYIVEFEQNGNIKAEYGSELLDRLYQDLKRQYGKGFSRSNLIYTRKFYLSVKKTTGGALKFLSPLQATGHYGIFPTDRTTALQFGRPKGRGIKPSRD